MKNYEEFINEEYNPLNEGMSAELKAKFKEKVEIAKMAVEKWGDSYNKSLTNAESYASGSVAPKYDDRLHFQGDEKKDNYEIFKTSSAIKLATDISKIIKKYKKYEAASDTVAAAAGWSGTARSSRSGFIRGVTSARGNGRDIFVIAVQIGSNVDSKIQEKLKQELFEVMYVYDQYNSSDGGVMYDTLSGTNYDTIGLTRSEESFNRAFGTKLETIMNGE